MDPRNLKAIVREEIVKILEKKGPGTVRPPQVTDKILPDHDTESKIYGGATLDLDVDGKPNNPKKLGTRDVYNDKPAYKKPKTLSEGMSYHIKNDLTLDENVFRPGTREFFELFNEARELWRAGKYAATREEYELFQSDIGQWAMYEGRMVPLDFPIWDEGLNESFADHYGDQHGRWVELTHADLEEHPEIYDEIFSIIDQSYAYIGGHANYKSANSVRSSDIALFTLIDLDDDREVDAASMSKRTEFGLKKIASATDGTKAAKSALKTQVGKELTTPGYYAEVSDTMAKVALSRGAKPVSDEKVVRKVLKGKDIEWFGENPDGQFPGTYGWYRRSIGGEDHVKIMVGLPNVEGLSEAKYKGRTVKLGKAGATRSGGRAHVFVRDPKTGNIKKVSFGSSMPDAMGSGPKAKARRKSFGERHQCSQKHDKTKGGYWACRATKLFGRNVPGWW
jgi:hypothetical protein